MMNWLSAVIAYIDPGSGGLLVQVLVASLLMLGVYFRRLLFAPVNFFRRVVRGWGSADSQMPDSSAREHENSRGNTP